MQQSIMIGGTARGSDGQIGTIGGLIINPTRSHLDYLIVHADAAGSREYYVPSGMIQQLSGQGAIMRVDGGELDDLPHPGGRAEQGTLLDNLGDLCVAHARTPVTTIEGDALGELMGLVVDSDLLVRAVLLAQSPDTAVPIARVGQRSDTTDTLIVELPTVAAAREEGI
jgi:hypothetical protein